MTASDPAALAAFHAQAFAAPWSAREFADLMSQPGVVAIAESDGFVLIRIVLDEAEILTLAVLPKARRLGLGRRLVEEAAIAATQAGAARLFLEVAEDNAPARALYDRAGFSQIGRRKAYYAAADGSRTDAVVMSRNLCVDQANVPLP
ncbi:ribosomal protein S18-alanine N-acetyltransferase [Brevundimonas intermedia]|uniref:ribosomal protein S18-alanine N-acetyltransferase n=1 Tax=Brevundimonas intermedia TaxID=74315 RepID=UPI003207FDE8